MHTLLLLLLAPSAILTAPRRSIVSPQPAASAALPTIYTGSLLPPTLDRPPSAAPVGADLEELQADPKAQKARVEALEDEVLRRETACAADDSCPVALQDLPPVWATSGMTLSERSYLALQRQSILNGHGADRDKVPRRDRSGGFK